MSTYISREALERQGWIFCFTDGVFEARLLRYGMPSKYDPYCHDESRPICTMKAVAAMTNIPMSTGGGGE